MRRMRSRRPCRSALAVAPLLWACLTGAGAVAADQAGPPPPEGTSGATDQPRAPVSGGAASGQAALAFQETATVTALPLPSATASVSVLDRQEVERSDARTIGDLMRFVPGVDISTNGTRGGLTTAQLRGGDVKSMVLLDGVPVDDATYQVGDVYDLEGLPAAAVERIEVVRGPLSSFFGSTGLSGVVNVITRRGRPGPLAGRASIAAGNAALRQGNGSLSGGLGRGAYLLGGGWEEESRRVARESFRQLDLYGNLDQPLGPAEAPAPGAGAGMEAEKNQRTGPGKGAAHETGAAGETGVGVIAAGAAGTGMGAAAELRLTGRLSRWHGDDYPEASGGPLFGDGELRRSAHREESLAAEVAFGGAEHPSRWTAAIYRHELERTSPAVLAQVPAAVESTSFTRLRAGGAGTLHAGRDSQWSGGLDVDDERGVNHSLLELAFPRGVSLRGDYRAARTSLGAFAEALLQCATNLTVEVGGRVDRVDGAGARGGRTRGSPRLGVSYRPGGGATRLHAAAGTAFKVPSFFALASPRALGGNPDLRPETSAGGDAGLDHHFAGARLDLTASVFYNRFRDLIDFDFKRFLHVNRSAVEARGAELALAWHPTERLGAGLAATFQDVRDLTAPAPLLHRPRWVGGGHVDWQPSAALRLRLDSQAVSRSLDHELPVPDRTSVAGYQAIGAGATWQLADRWQLRGRLDNLAGRRYQVLVGFPGAGRAIRLGLQYTS